MAIQTTFHINFAESELLNGTLKMFIRLSLMARYSVRVSQDFSFGVIK